MKESLSLLTDLYQLTMAYGYWKRGLHKKEAVFHLFFRKKPFKGSFALAAGLETAIEFIENFSFEKSDLSYLESLQDEGGEPLFEKDFIAFLETFKFDCDIDALPEGTPVFPHEPLVRVQGSLLAAQLLESPLLNLINFPTLVATKAERICYAASPDPVVEFGLRRAQGMDGALTASRASFIGGCVGTSNLLAGKRYGIPVRGTHAHSWVMAFEKEEEAFEAFCEVYPSDAVFLIDTYDSVEGAKKAVAVGKRMRKGTLKGVRIDSGDLAHLSIAVRKILDEGGFPEASIMASNELDEFIIQDLKHQGAKIDIWGVGTHLVTGKDQPALDGVYKLSAVRENNQAWEEKLKLSDQVAKTTTPGILQVRRFFDEKGYSADMIFDVRKTPKGVQEIVDPFDPARRKWMDESTNFKDLLVPIMRHGKVVYPFPTLSQIQKYAKEETEKLHPSVRRFLHPHPYFAGLSVSLYEFKLGLIDKSKRR